VTSKWRFRAEAKPIRGAIGRTRIAAGATLGWVIGTLDGVRYFGKQGGGFGFHDNARIYPELGLGTVLLANRTEITPSPIDARSDVLDLGFVRERKRAQATELSARHEKRNSP
jgi:hypothetical protein